MAITKVITVDAQTSDAEKKIKGVTKATRDLNKASDEVSGGLKKTTEEVTKNGGAIAILDAATGGLATQFKNLFEASSLFRGSLPKLGKAIKGFSTTAKAALISTGIGALVVLVGVLVSQWDNIKGLVNGISGEMAKQGKQAQKLVDAEQAKLDIVNGQDNILKQQGKSEKEILQIKNAQLKNTFKAAQVQLENTKNQKKAQLEAAKRNRDILAGTLKFVSLPITALLKGIDEIGKAFGKGFGLSKAFDNVANLVFDPEKTKEEGDKVIQEQEKKLLALQNQLAGNELAIDKINKDAATKAVEREKKKLEDIQALKDKFTKADEDLDAKTAEQKLQLERERAQAELDNLIGTETEKREAQIALDALFDQKEAELKAQREEEKRVKEEELRQQKLEAEAAFVAQMEEIKAREIEAEDRLVEAKRGALNLGLSLLKDFAGKNKALAIAILAVEKGLAVAEVITNTSKGIAASQANLAAVPPFIGTFPNPVYLGALGAHIKNVAALKIGAGVQIASILATTIKAASGGGGGSVGGGAGGGGGAPAGGGAQAPAFNIVGASGTNQLAETIAARENEPVRAFVVGSEVTSQQALDRNIEDTASL